MMDLYDVANMRRVLRTMSKEWRVPVWKVEQIIQESIDRTWERAKLNPERQQLLDQYFPNGKPTPFAYILRMGQAHERHEYIPPLMED